MPPLRALRGSQNRSPVAIIHHPNDSMGVTCNHLQRPSSLTSSVNSVRTPVTHYQLLTNSRQLATIIEKDKPSSASSETFVHASTPADLPEPPPPLTTEQLYPGKRYLYSDTGFHNNCSFTDSVFCPPTPTEEKTTHRAISEIFHSIDNATANAAITTTPTIDRLEDRSSSADSSESPDQPSSDSEGSSDGTSTTSAGAYSSLGSAWSYPPNHNPSTISLHSFFTFKAAVLAIIIVISVTNERKHTNIIESIASYVVRHSYSFSCRS